MCCGKGTSLPDPKPSTNIQKPSLSFIKGETRILLHCDRTPTANSSFSVGCAGGGIGGRRWDRRFPPLYAAPPSLFSPSLRSSHSRLWQSELLPSLQSATISAYEIVAAAAIAANPGEIPPASSSPSLEPVGLHPPVRGLHPRAIPDSVSSGCSSKSEPSPLTDLVSSLDDLRLYREVTLVPSIS